jgi:hypothetical protein
VLQQEGKEMSAPDDEPMEEWQVGDVEPVLHNLKAEIAILGHLIATPDEVASITWARLEDAMTNTHTALWDRWHGSWRFRIAERNEAMAALEAAQAERAAPGSVWPDVRPAGAFSARRRVSHCTNTRGLASLPVPPMPN